MFAALKRSSERLPCRRCWHLADDLKGDIDNHDDVDENHIVKSRVG